MLKLTTSVVAAAIRGAVSLPVHADCEADIAKVEAEVAR